MEIARLKKPQIINSGKKVPGAAVKRKERENRLQLPTEKTEPEKEISRFKYYFFGGRKVGKTSMVSEFPDCLNVFSEPSGSDYRIYAVNCFCWDDVLDIVEDIEKHGEAGTLKYKNVSFDIVDKFYKWNIENVCLRRGCTEDDLGWGWDEVKKDFEEIINRLARYVGVIFVSHVKEREIDRADGTKYATLMPSSMKNCYDLISSICDMTAYLYIAPDNTRRLRILPHMESTTGNRFENHFNYRDGGKIDEIEMGITKKDAYQAFERAFNNDVDKPEFVEPVKEVEDVVDESKALPKRGLKFIPKGK